MTNFKSRLLTMNGESSPLGSATNITHYIGFTHYLQWAKINQENKTNVASENNKVTLSSLLHNDNNKPRDHLVLSLYHSMMYTVCVRG